MEFIDVLSMCHIDSSVTVDDNYTTIIWRALGEEAHKIEIIDNDKRLIVHHTYMNECKTAFLSRDEFTDLIRVLDRRLTGVFSLYFLSRGL